MRSIEKQRFKMNKFRFGETVGLSSFHPTTLKWTANEYRIRYYAPSKVSHAKWNSSCIFRRSKNIVIARNIILN